MPWVFLLLFSNVLLVDGLLGWPSNPHLLVFTPLCNLLPLSVGGTCDLLLPNRIQKWWMSFPWIGYIGLQSPARELSLSLAGWDGVSIHVGKVPVTSPGGWLLADSQQEAESLSPTATRNWILPMTTARLKTFPSSVRPSDETMAWHTSRFQLRL